MTEKPTYEALERRVRELEKAESERNRAQLALRESEDRYRDLIDFSPVPFLITQGERVVFANPAAAKLFGTGHPDEIVGSGPQDWVRPDFAERAYRRRCRAVEAGESLDPVELVLVGKDDQERVVIANTTRVSHLGSPALLSVFQDITGRKRMEEALEGSYEKLKQSNQILGGVLEHTHMMAVFLDTRFNFIWVNRAYAETCRRDRSYFPGKNHFDLYPHSENQAIFQRVVDTGEPFFVEAKPFEFPDQPERGVTYWDWSLIPIKDDAGEVVGLVFTLAEVTGRILAETGLRKSEENFRTLIENVVDWVWVVDERGAYSYVSPQAETLMGYAAHEILGKTPFDFMSPSEAERVAPVFSRAVEGRERILGLEDTLLAKDGSEVVFETNATPLFGSEGDFIGYMGTCRDITRRKREEEGRRLNEARLEALLRLNDMQGADSDELSLFAVEESARLTGSDIGFINFLSHDERFVTRAVYTGNTLAQCSLPEEVPAFEISECGLWSEAYRRRRPIVMNDYTEEHAAKVGFPPGHPVLRRFVSIPVFEGDRVVAVAALGNKQEPYNPGDVRQFRLFMEGLWRIVQRKRIDDALRESEQRFRELAELLPETIFEMDLEGTLTFVNRKAFEKFGYSREDFDAGVNAFHTVVERDRARAKENYRRIVQGETVGMTEYEARRKDGTTFPALWHSNAIKRNGKVVGLRGFIIDVTQERQLEARLKQAQKMKAIGTLAGGIAHDFNNILGIIVGNTELAMFDIPEWSPAQESLEEVREASLRARDLVTQILLFARQKEQAVSNIRVEPIARESLKMLRATIPTTVEIREEIREDLPAVQADPAQIQQIVMNLCTNAGQVMEAEGGTLTFTLDLAEPEGPVETQSGRIPGGRYVRLRVRDTGPGIPPESLERIFEPFFTTKGVGEGTGLGLAVVHGIVQDRHGGVVVESEEGKGSVFSVYLPACEERPAEGRLEEDAALPKGRERILFVDDEPMIMKLGQRMLERQGYEVVTRASGTDALACFEQDPERFDLVVTDMTMPGLRGDKLAGEMLKIRPDLPVILSTGFSKQISEERAEEMGIRAFVMKPLTARELASTVRRVLDERRS